MVNLTINGQKISVSEGTTILEAALKVGIDIPHLCYLKDINEIGACRVCVVENAGMETLVTACNTPVEEGMELYTNSPKAREARRINVSLILSDHDAKCATCVRSGNCNLQKIANDLGILEVPYANIAEKQKWDKKQPLIRDASKCIKCMRCIQICDHIQGLNVWGLTGTGYRTTIGISKNVPIRETNCSFCGQCITHCPVGALRERDDTMQLLDALADPEKITMVQIAPAVRTAWGESVGLYREESTLGKLVAALKQIGFDYVFDTGFTADLTIMEEGSEFLQHFGEKDKHKWPLFTSCCPGWVRFVKNEFPEFAENLSTAKSPQQMFGAMSKTYIAQKLGVDPEKIYSVSIMPCTAKKEEILRPESYTNGKQDVDYVLTTTEIVRMIRKSGIVFDKVEIEAADVPFGIGSGSGVIFGVTGGVTEAVLRRLQQGHNRVDMESIKKSGVRGDDGIKVLTYNYNGREIKAAVVNGLANADKVLQQIKNHEAEYDFVEVMACRRGCIMGGGQPVNAGPRTRKARMKGLYDTDVNTQIKKSNENPMILSLYDTLLKGKEHELLHRNFSGK